MAANDFEIQKTYIQLFKKIQEFEKDPTAPAPDWVADAKSWIIGATWALNLAMNWIENNTLVPLPAEIELLKSSVEVKKLIDL